MSSIPTRMRIHQVLAKELGEDVNNIVIELDSDLQEEAKEPAWRRSALLEYLVPARGSRNRG